MTEQEMVDLRDKLAEEYSEIEGYSENHRNMFKNGFDACRSVMGDNISNLEDKIYHSTRKVEELEQENFRLAAELINVLTNHPLYNINKELELENRKIKDALRIAKDSLLDISYEGHSELCKSMKPIRSSYICTKEIAEEALNKIDEVLE